MPAHIPAGNNDILPAAHGEPLDLVPRQSAIRPALEGRGGPWWFQKVAAIDSFHVAAGITESHHAPGTRSNARALPFGVASGLNPVQQRLHPEHPTSRKPQPATGETTSDSDPRAWYMTPRRGSQVSLAGWLQERFGRAGQPRISNLGSTRPSSKRPWAPCIYAERSRPGRLSGTFQKKSDEDTRLN